MIRINLLPTAKKAARPAAAPTGGGGSTGWAVGYFVAALVWIVCLAGVYVTYSAELEEKQQANQVVRQRIDEIRAESARLEEVRAKIAASQELENLVNDLNRARVGPARMLMELSAILSARGGPTIDPERLAELRQENPTIGFNRSWDTQRLWLTSFREEDRSCRITGLGKTNEDVAEFLRRLALSELFEDVTLERTEARVDPETSLTFIGFELSCRVRY